MARPKKYKLDTDQVTKLAAFGCTNVEIASFFDCSESLLCKSYSRFLTKGREKGKIRLRQLQWRAAEKGSHTMLIWLVKQVLGQSDTPEIMEDELVKGFDLEII